MSEQKIFGREDILAAKEKRNVIRIDDVPGLNGSIYIRELKRAEFGAWLQSGTDDRDSKIVAQILCDESGALLFKAEDEMDLIELENSLTAKQLAHIGMRGMVENSANPKVAEKNLQASLNAPSNSV